MGAKLSLELSDGLEEMVRLFAPYEHEARVLQPSDARALVECCRIMKSRAREMENQLSAKMWNDAARDDRIAEGRRIIAEIERPGTNVVLFPIVHRPFSDGQDGAA